jgi:hypothetical protein
MRFNKIKSKAQMGGTGKELNRAVDELKKMENLLSSL